MSLKNNEKEGILATYGRQRGRKLRTNPSRLMEELLPKLALELPAAGGLDLRALFPGKKEIWLEIGFGGGEHLAHLAAAHPDVGFIGCEVFVNGVAALLGHIDKRQLSNVRIFQGDARDVLAAAPSHSFSRIYIFHPDPWPKARHHKRRLISPAFLHTLHEKLTAGGRVKIATDWPDYANWIMERFLSDPRFVWTAQSSADWTTRFAESCATRYAVKAAAEGRPAAYFEFIRK